jgi:hypothetical protein
MLLTKRFGNDDAGGTSLEYGLIAAGIAVGLSMFVVSLGARRRRPSKPSRRKLCAKSLPWSSGYAPGKNLRSGRWQLAQGLKKLKRAAYHAHKARARASRPLETELLRISASIALHGLDAQLAGDLRSTVGSAVVVEAETGEPVARRIATAVEWFAKPHARPAKASR